jgi:hypothetical protein
MRQKNPNEVINETPEGKKGKRAVDPKDFMVSKQMK